MQCIFGKLQDNAKLLPSKRMGKSHIQFSWGKSSSEEHVPPRQLHHMGKVTDTPSGLNPKLLQPCSGHFHKRQ